MWSWWKTLKIRFAGNGIFKRGLRALLPSLPGFGSVFIGYVPDATRYAAPVFDVSHSLQRCADSPMK